VTRRTRESSSSELRADVTASTFLMLVAARRFTGLQIESTASLVLDDPMASAYYDADASATSRSLQPRVQAALGNATQRVAPRSRLRWRRARIRRLRRLHARSFLTRRERDRTRATRAQRLPAAWCRGLVRLSKRRLSSGGCGNRRRCAARPDSTIRTGRRSDSDDSRRWFPWAARRAVAARVRVPRARHVACDVRSL
jgi:hypothetical protein